MTKNQIAIDAIIVAAKIIIVSNNVEQNMDGMDTKELKGWRRWNNDTFNLYIMLVKIYCEIVGSNAELGSFLVAGFIMYVGHCVCKALCS